MVARYKEVLILIEVKSESSTAFGGPLAAVTFHKRRKLIRRALEYITRSRLAGVACRFSFRLGRVAVKLGLA